MKMINQGHLGGYIAGGDPATWCPALWSWAVRDLGVRSVLDVGCGEGHASRFFREAGCRIQGLDGLEQAIRDTVIPGNVVLHDFCRGPWHTADEFDLVWSCELLEHIEEIFLPNVLATFRASRRLLFVTHAFPGQPGHHHVNCRPTSYWIEVLERAGFVCDVGLTLKARRITLSDLPSYPNHFARSGLVLRRREAGAVDDRAAVAAGGRPGADARVKSFLLRGASKITRRLRGLPG